MQVDRIALLDAAEEILIPFDFEIGMEAALHQDAGAAQIICSNLFVDDLLGST